MLKEQYVCTVCGYNMIDRYPDLCPFCGATQENFLTATEISIDYRVVATPVNSRVTMLRSQPPLGFEHAAYRVETGNNTVWIDCPSTFDQTLGVVDRIYYTHHHFLGAGNLYQHHLGTSLAIHDKDSRHELCQGYAFDLRFDADFNRDGIEAVHIDGHTPGFTIYRFEDILFLCDFVFYNQLRAKFNPYGPAKATRLGGEQLLHLLQQWQIRLICGFDYAAPAEEWLVKFRELLATDTKVTARHAQ